MKNKILYTMLLGAAMLFASCDKGDGGGTTVNPDKLDKPTLVEESKTNTSVKVSWEAIENADSYVYQLGSGDQETTEELFAEFNDLEEGTYLVRVKAVAEDPEAYPDSDWGTLQVTITIVVSPVLDKPVITLIADDPESFTINWKSVTNATGYIYSLNDGEEQETSGRTASFDRLTPGETYTVKVWAVDNKGNFEKSEAGEFEITLDEKEYVLEFKFLDDEFQPWNRVVIAIRTADAVWGRVGTFEPGTSDDDVKAALNRGGDKIVSVDVSMTNGHPYSVEITNLTPGKTYKIGLWVRYSDGGERYETTEKTLPESVADPKLQKWLGTYKITSSSRLQFYIGSGGGIVWNTVNEPFDFTENYEPVVIGVHENDLSYLKMRGWSRYVTDRPWDALASTAVFDNGTEALGQNVVGVQYGPGGNWKGWPARWVGFFQYEGNTDVMNIGVRIPYAFYFFDDGPQEAGGPEDQVIEVGERIRVVPYTETDGKGPLTVLASEAIGYTDGGGLNPAYHIYELPLTIGAGEFTMEKIDDASFVPSPFSAVSAGPAATFNPKPTTIVSEPITIKRAN